MTDPASSSITNTSSTAMPLHGSNVHAISTLKLPTFLTLDSSSWFQRVEIQFYIRKITNSKTKAGEVLAEISEDLFPQDSAWLNRQSDHILYDDLKIYLLYYFTLFPANHTVRILQPYQQPLGDQYASMEWHELQALSRSLMIAMATPAPLIFFFFFVRDMVVPPPYPDPCHPHQQRKDDDGGSTSPC